MRQRPAEVHFRVHQLAVTNSQDFGVSKAIAASVSAFVGHEHAFTLLHEMDEFEVGGVRAVGPAAFEVHLAIDALVERAGEVKVVGDQPGVRSRNGNLCTLRRLVRSRG